MLGLVLFCSGFVHCLLSFFLGTIIVSPKHSRTKLIQFGQKAVISLMVLQYSFQKVSLKK